MTGTKAHRHGGTKGARPARSLRASVLLPVSPSPRLPVSPSAFTLVELLVVLGIIALLISILLPALSRASEQAKSTACLSNLRQLATMAHLYAADHKGTFPIAWYAAVEPGRAVAYHWDFTTERDLATGAVTARPGLLFSGKGNGRVQQCPSFDGRSNTPADPFTGYNYNTSYVGGEQVGAAIIPPARVSAVREPSRLALFGDGQYGSGANKFMRSPFPSPTEASVPRHAGTQGFRHRGRTNVAFADGHAESLAQRHTTTTPDAATRIAPGTGFLSEDNRLYTLR